MKKLIVLSVLFTGCFANDSLSDKQVEVKAVMQVDTENSHDLWAGRRRGKERGDRRRGGNGLK